MKKVLGWRVRRCRGAAEYLGFAVGPSTPFPWVKREFSRLYETREGAKDHATWMRSGYAGTEIVRIVAKPKVPKSDKLEQAIVKIESVIARTRQDLEDAKRDEEWSNVAAYHNQALAEDNVLRILRGFR